MSWTDMPGPNTPTLLAPLIEIGIKAGVGDWEPDKSERARPGEDNEGREGSGGKVEVAKLGIMGNVGLLKLDVWDSGKVGRGGCCCCCCEYNSSLLMLSREGSEDFNFGMSETIVGWSGAIVGVPLIEGTDGFEVDSDSILGWRVSAEGLRAAVFVGVICFVAASEWMGVLWGLVGSAEAVASEESESVREAWFFFFCFPPFDEFCFPLLCILMEWMRAVLVLVE
jgi:hypothetical protein